jgi:hypothetical protein
MQSSFTCVESRCLAEIRDKERQVRLLSRRVENLEAHILDMTRRAMEASAAEEASRTEYEVKLALALDALGWDSTRRLRSAERAWNLERRRLRAEIERLQLSHAVPALGCPESRLPA